MLGPWDQAASWESHSQRRKTFPETDSEVLVLSTALPAHKRRLGPSYEALGSSSGGMYVTGKCSHEAIAVSLTGP